MKVTIVIYKFTIEIYKSIRKLYMRNKSKTEHIYNSCLKEKGIYEKYVSKKIYKCNLQVYRTDTFPKIELEVEQNIITVVTLKFTS
jgi:hypothetical protein